MTLEDLGAALREEREKRGLHIEDIAKRLKISVRLLRALEDADMESLPHSAYTRGFIRSYAGYLGMSAEEINDAVNALPERSNEPLVPQPIYYEEAPNSEKAGWRIALALFLVLGIALGGYAVWRSGILEMLPWQKRLWADPAPAEEPQREERPIVADNDALSAHAPSASRDAPPTGRNVRKSRIASPDAASSETRPTPKNDAENNTPAAKPSPSLVRETPAGHKVIIVATEECWIHSNADESETRQFSLRKNDTFALTFTKKLELKLGNAGGVRIRYNGRELPQAGRSGQVMTLVLPPDVRQ